MELRTLFRKHVATEIADPKILVCGLGAKFADMLAVDGDSYRRFYAGTTATTFTSFREFLAALREGYDVVHMFCDASPDGGVTDGSGGSMTGVGLIQMCCDSSVKLLWVASENKPDAYIRGFKSAGNRLNMVMTIARRGADFTAFLEKLLSKMSRGETMTGAWAAISPQSPNAPGQENAPACIFAAGLGGLRLRSGKYAVQATH